MGTPRTHLPAFYFHAAAHGSIERARFDVTARSRTVARRETVLKSKPRRTYVGQLKLANTADEPLSDAQFLSYLRHKDTRRRHLSPPSSLDQGARSLQIELCGHCRRSNLAALVGELADEYRMPVTTSARKPSTLLLAYRRELGTNYCSQCSITQTCAKALGDDDAYLRRVWRCLR